MVSVVIPTFNRAHQVTRAVQSVLDQTFRDFEIIIVDDGSTDETKTAVSRFQDRVKLIVHDENLGVSAARNTGIHESAEAFVAFLDSDDFWLPNKLQKQIQFFETNPNALICQTEEIWIRNGHRVNPRKKHRKPSGDIFEQSLKRCLVSPSAVMLKRSVFDEIGGFDESLPACEDYDMWLRIAWRYPIFLIPDRLIVKIGGHSDQLSRRYTGMDRFRVMSILKLLENSGLNQQQRLQAKRALAFKCTVYGRGCTKRGKIEEGNDYLRIAEKMRTEIAEAVKT